MDTDVSIALQVGRLENAIGWYHSHPGYGCWLSGIDVSTQMLNQQFQEPFVAIVVGRALLVLKLLAVWTDINAFALTITRFSVAHYSIPALSISCDFTSVA